MKLKQVLDSMVSTWPCVKTGIPWLTYRRNLRINPKRFPKALHRFDGYLGVGEIPTGMGVVPIHQNKLASAKHRNTQP